MSEKIFDLLIVGQGLAGINLSYDALSKGLDVHHIHFPTVGESTKVAAGLINPITGRRFVKSWLIDEVMPFAEKRYSDFGDLLKGNYISLLNIVRVFHQAEDENTWLAKSADPYLAQFLLEKSEWSGGSEFHSKLKIPELIGELQNCFKIHLNDLQKDYHNYLETQELISYEMFDYNQCLKVADCFKYKNISARTVIFADGWKVLDNPFFSNDPFSPAKGELLIIKIPDLKLNKAYKKSSFITPLGNDLYWVGATYEWQNYDTSPTEKMKSRILKHFHEMIDTPYEIVHHLTGIRPSSKDRRPVIGESSSHQGIFTFNGMGTKGSSLAPLFSKMLIEHIFENKEIMEEVDIKRYITN
ncbi:FAD-dependent oxidoreductase [Saprospiraceae bacterium]|nr:FAD-dependent oxidoreductase [Saprospiraceae bacterium]